jgi:hypothetical protein
MKNYTGGVCLAALAIALAAAPLYANVQSSLPRRAAAVSHYDLAREVILEGTVQSVDAKPSVAMMFGEHLTVATAHGIVEAQVGRFLLRGPGAESFAAGQQVKLVGLMTTINHRQILMTRLIVTGGRTITVRNQNGFAISPAARLREARLAAAGGAR